MAVDGNLLKNIGIPNKDNILWYLSEFMFQNRYCSSLDNPILEGGDVDKI
jgi:hypothetical protein